MQRKRGIEGIREKLKGANWGSLGGAMFYLASLGLFFSSFLASQGPITFFSLLLTGGSILLWGHLVGMKPREILGLWPLALIPPLASLTFLLLSTGFATLMMWSLVGDSTGGAKGVVEEEYLGGLWLVMASLVVANLTGRMMLLWSEWGRKRGKAIRVWAEATLLSAPLFLPLLFAYLYPLFAPPSRRTDAP